MTPAELQTAIADARQAYFDNAEYESSGSAAQCRLFITACRQLLMLPKRASSGERDEEVEIDHENLRSELRAAREWLADAVANAEGGGSVTHVDFSGFRE